MIAEDEPLQRRHIRSLLEAAAGDVVVVDEAADGMATVAALREHRPELLFLDVQMPGLDAFGVIDEIGMEDMPLTIFVTAYDRYAVRAFEVHALDYLLKPYDAERFGAAVRRAISQLRQRTSAAHDGARLVALLAELRERGAYAERLPIRVGGRVRFVEVPTIDRIEAAGKNVRVHAAGEVHEYRDTLSRLEEEELDPRKFVRVHRSTIVNVARVREVQSWFGGEYVLILKDGARVTTGRGYRESVARLVKRG